MKAVWPKETKGQQEKWVLFVLGQGRHDRDDWGFPVGLQTLLSFQAVFSTFLLLLWVLLSLFEYFSVLIFFLSCFLSSPNHLFQQNLSEYWNQDKTATVLVSRQNKIPLSQSSLQHRGMEPVALFTLSNYPVAELYSQPLVLLRQLV